MQFMKTFKLILLQLITLGSYGQNTTKEIKFTQINWTLSVPAIANVHSAIMQDTIIQISPSYIKERVTIEKDSYNTFSIKVRSSDPDSLKAMTDEEAFNQSNKIIALTFNRSGSDIKFIDSASSFDVIDGVRFDMFNYKIKPEKYPMFNCYVAFGKYEGHDINIFISYDNINLDLGKYFLDILKQSRFGKDKEDK